jgi:hypothetical protein
MGILVPGLCYRANRALNRICTEIEGFSPEINEKEVSLLAVVLHGARTMPPPVQEQHSPDRNAILNASQ